MRTNIKNTVWLFVGRSYPQRWWRRVYDEEFYPTVHLGSSFLEGMLNQYGLKVNLLSMH